MQRTKSGGLYEGCPLNPGLVATYRSKVRSESTWKPEYRRPEVVVLGAARISLL